MPAGGPILILDVLVTGESGVTAHTSLVEASLHRSPLQVTHGPVRLVHSRYRASLLKTLQ